MYDLKGNRVLAKGFYMDIPVSGIVIESRMRNHELIHYVQLDKFISVYGSIRNSVILRNCNIDNT